uniref:Uncharacterized protein n=1 Tax=Arundo donax TaxID=35708 RepID=A0A0A9AS47_ARUDO
MKSNFATGHQNHLIFQKNS